MTKPSDGSVIKFLHRGRHEIKRRTGVVVASYAGTNRVLTIYGSTQVHPWPNELVRKATIYATDMRLSANTFFYEEALEYVDLADAASEVELILEACPPKLLTRLRAAAQRGLPRWLAKRR